jgi:hypothetical protein
MNVAEIVTNFTGLRYLYAHTMISFTQFCHENLNAPWMFNGYITELMKSTDLTVKNGHALNRGQPRKIWNQQFAKGDETVS